MYYARFPSFASPVFKGPNRAHINPFLPNQIFAQSGNSEGDWPFLYKGRIIRLDELGQTFCSSSGSASQV